MKIWRWYFLLSESLSLGGSPLQSPALSLMCGTGGSSYNTENGLLQFQTTEVLSHPTTRPTLSGRPRHDTQYSVTIITKQYTNRGSHYHFYLPFCRLPLVKCCKLKTCKTWTALRPLSEISWISFLCKCDNDEININEQLQSSFV